MEASNFTFATTKLANLTNLLVNVLNDGGKYASAVITANTSQAMQPLKNGCPYRKDEVTKNCEYSVGLNGIYTNAVNNQRQREGKDADFQAKENWFVRLYDMKNGSIVAKRSEVEKNIPLTEVYVFITTNSAKTNQYFIKGIEANKEEVDSIKKWKAIRTAENQGLEDIVVVNTIKASGITEIHANGLKLQF